MRLGILLLILTATLFGSSYWYQFFDRSCRVPIEYRLGEVDERFGTSSEELKRILVRGEALWEDALDAHLFEYVEHESALPVNFIFDERQARAEAEEEVRHDLEVKEGMSESVASQYETLIAEYRKLKKNYETRVVTYESNLSSYNKEVSEWNKKGGASDSVIEELEATEAELLREQSALEALAKTLNGLVTQLNQIGAKGNELITDYNKIVEEYNAEFSEGDEFTQGEYTTDAINIYQFNSEDELVVVLAHEFGHALALDHVPNEVSIMYSVMKNQDVTSGITAEDRTEYTRVCSDKSALESLFGIIFGRL